MNPARTVTLSARYVFPVEGPPLENGWVAIRQGRILELGSASTTAPELDLDLGNVAITPGFTNAHTHLELPPLGREVDGIDDEIEWLRRVVEYRRSSSQDSAMTAVREHTSQSLAAGTTLVADTTTAGLSWETVASSPLRGVVFAEILGLRRSRGLETNQAAWEWISSVGSMDQVRGNARPGLSPHAPYSTAGWLYHRAASSRLPLSTHLAEMPEELELLEHGTGRLRTFLEEMGAWDDDWSPIGTRPADYIRRDDLRRADWIVAHGTYLDSSDFWQLRPEAAPDGQRVAVAYCPRTHARFRHAPHPYRAMMERGIVVCLGTDSLASSLSLSVLDEARFLYRLDPSLGGHLLLAMATLFGAWAMRAENVTGSLRPGKSADMALVGLPDREEEDPYRLLFDSDRPVIGSIFEGHLVHGPEELGSLLAGPE